MKIAPAQDGLAIMDLVMNASLLVQLVMLLLLAASLVSWTMIFRKFFALKAAFRDARRFEDRFWSGMNLNQLYADLSRKEAETSGMANIFLAGFREYAKLDKQKNIQPTEVVEGAQRVMRVALSREIDDLETSLSFLATVGSTSPYIGLFGTVWGIMNSFRSLGVAQQATLAAVAPGIAEALIATAMGLFAAIPAVIAYNRYSRNVERLVNQYENFLEEFSSVLQRQAYMAKG